MCQETGTGISEASGSTAHASAIWPHDWCGPSDRACFSTRYSAYVLLDSKRPDHVAEKLMEHWCSFAGPPESVVHDKGGEFDAAFRNALERWHATPSVGPGEAPWQQALIERHGQVLGDVVRCVVDETLATGETEMRMACFFAAFSKNRRVDRSGHSPRERLF